jgi:cation-transporting ATPase E
MTNRPQATNRQELALLAIRGLSESEAAERRAQGQGNDVPLQTSRSYMQIVRENVFSFINNVLFGLGIALIVLGQVSSALLSVGVVLLNVIVSVVQEIRAKRMLDHIALLTRPKATVLRDGQERPIDPSEIVQGDVLLVRPGDQIVVDGPLIGEGHIDVDESLLTGESDPVAKRPGDPLYSGSFCLTGSGAYLAEKVGTQSVAHQLTEGARTFRRVYTPLQQQIDLVIRVILLLVVFFELLLGINTVVQGISVVTSVKMSVVVVGLVPIGLFLAIATAYALGAVRISRQGALVQQANAVESLSHVDMLCLDKTGTLTANALIFHALAPLERSEPELRRMLGDYVASVTAPNSTSAAIAKACPGQARQVREEVAFSSARKWSALALDDPALRGVYVLGAPEMLQPALRPGADLGTQGAEWAEAGLRVLLFACVPELVALHDASGQPTLPDGLIPLGLLSLSDELRPEARETLSSFAGVGVQCKIISGDNPQTVAALARQAGFPADLKVVSGLDLDGLDDATFAQVAEETTVFGRITPQQKARLVQALRSRGHYVAMIGDGVNDVLSLKQANLGLAMHSGSQAARGVADMVLLQDSFAVLPAAFGEGQRITNGMDNILKLFLTRVLYMAVLFIATGVIGGFPFSPNNSSLLIFFTVGAPTIALAAWAHPGAVSPQRLRRSLAHFVIPAAITLALGSLAVYLVHFIPAYRELAQGAPALARSQPMQGFQLQAQSAVTTFGVLAGLLLILFVEPPSRAWVGGDALNGDWRAVLLVVVLLLGYVAVLLIPPLGTLFDLPPLSIPDYLLLGGVVIVWALALRWVWRAHLMERFLGLHWEDLQAETNPS